ncbi:MAG: glycosyltransferase [Candidatus Methanoperedens sp.]|nr:glycosyltransferase [Candidatus Methanoperedens sp.]
MTATYSKGDAIGNYIQTLDRIFHKFSFDTKIFSDFTLKNPHSSKYKPTGNDILWFHYSLYSDNLQYLEKSNDTKIIDFHGVTPSYLFRGYNAELERLCQKGNDLLKQYSGCVDLCVVHSEYSRSVLENNGYKNIIRLPLVVDMHRLEKIKQDEKLATSVKKIKYMLFVGRIVPQKSIINIIKVFYHLKQLQTDFKLFFIGDYNFSKEYMIEIMKVIKQLNLFDDVVFTGKLDDSALITFYKHASLFINLSEWETFCVPLIEAMYYQIPIIGYNKTAVPETIGDAGILFDKIDYLEIAKRINELLNDTKKYELLKLKCEERIQYFTELQLELKLSPLLKELSGLNNENCLCGSAIRGRS